MPHAESDAAESSQTDLPHIYLELLPNIRTISLSVHPKLPTNEHKVIVNVRDGELVAFEQCGTTTLIPLPVNVVNDSTHPLRMIDLSSGDLTARLQPDLTSLQTLLDSCGDDYVPWSAHELETSSKIRCASCDAVIVDSSVMTSWKDLPSANWAEMMDFWHCHKPHENEKQHIHETTSSRGYSAGNHLTARRGVAYVDISSLLLSAEDCASVKVRFQFSVYNFHHMGNKKEALSTQVNTMNEIPIQLSYIKH